jgi:hypothetical protein
MNAPEYAGAMRISAADFKPDGKVVECNTARRNPLMPSSIRLWNYMPQNLP